MHYSAKWRDSRPCIRPTAWLDFAALVIACLALVLSGDVAAAQQAGGEVQATSQPAANVVTPGGGIAGRIGVVGGRPVPMAGDRILTTSYCDRFPWIKRMHHRNQRMAGIGVDLFQLQLRGDYPDFYSTRFWTDEGVYGDEDDGKTFYARLDNQANAILEVKPDAVFSIAVFLAPPKAWAQRFPEEIQHDGDGKPLRAASFASRKYISGVSRMLEEIVKYTQARPWGGRVVGYVLIPQNEGGLELSNKTGQLFDQSPAMTRRFQEAMREKYKTDAALQQAWGDDAFTLETLKQPTDAQWHADRNDWLNFPEPSETARYRDYFQTVNDCLHEYIQTTTTAVKNASNREVFVVVDALKQTMSGWLLQDAFFSSGYGMDFPDVMVASGTFNIARTLDLPSLDGLMTPADYTARSMNFALEPEGVADSLVLRGKVMMLEDDARSWLRPNFRDEQGAWRDEAEGLAGLMRNAALGISRGMFPHWANVAQGYFDHDKVMSLAAQVAQVRRKTMDQPLVHTPHAIAMILDDDAALQGDFTSGYFQIANMQQRVFHLAQTGLPYRIYLLSDLAREDFPGYRVYLFPDLIHMTPEKEALIREKVLRDGQVAIFGPMTAISDGSTISADHASKFLGIPMELTAKKAARRVMAYANTHPAMAHVHAPVTYGDSYLYGPILQPTYDAASDPAITELGKASINWITNRPGLIMRDVNEGDASIVFTSALPLPSNLLRSLALYAGCNPWSELGDVVQANGSFLSVHATRPGPRTITLPQPSNVIDLITGKTIATHASTFTLTLQSPETAMLRIEPASE